MLKVMGGSGGKPTLLVYIDGFGGRAEPHVCPVSDLDEGQGTGVAHDKIDLATPTAVVTLHQAQAPAFQVGAGHALLVPADGGG